MKFKEVKHKVGKLLVWIKKHIAITIIILLFFIIGIPIIIHILFKINAPFSFLAAKWEAGDMLSYYGSILTFLGTILLGALALWQNHIIQLEAEKHEKMLENMEISKHTPFFDLQFHYYNERDQIVIKLYNNSANLAQGINVFELKVYNIMDELIETYVDPYLSGKVLFPNDCIGIIFNTDFFTREYRLLLLFECSDKLKFKHHYEAEMILDEKKDKYILSNIEEKILI
jgi:hypothetical protein